MLIFCYLLCFYYSDTLKIIEFLHLASLKFIGYINVRTHCFVSAMTCPFHNHLWRYSHGQRITYDSSSSSSTEVLPHITDYQLVGDIFVYIKLHEFACKGEIVSQTDPNNYLFVLLIELDDDDNVKKGEQHPLWMLLPAVLFRNGNAQALPFRYVHQCASPSRPYHTSG